MWPFLKQTIQPNREESYKVSLASGLHTLLLLPIFNQRHYHIVYFAQIYTRVLWVHSDSSISGLILDIFSSLEPSLSRKIQLPCVSSTTSGFSSLIAMCANQNCHCLVRCSSPQMDSKSLACIPSLFPVCSPWLVSVNIPLFPLLTVKWTAGWLGMVFKFFIVILLSLCYSQMQPDILLRELSGYLWTCNEEEPIAIII